MVLTKLNLKLLARILNSEIRDKMGLKEISDLINKEENARDILIVSLAVIIGSSVFIGRQYEKLSNKLENGDYRRNAIIQEALFNAQDMIYKKKESLYQKMIIEQFGKEAVYRDIINGIIGSMQDYKERKQTSPAVKNLLEEI